MGTLLGFHIFHISRNVTTVEFHIEEMKTDVYILSIIEPIQKT